MTTITIPRETFDAMREALKWTLARVERLAPHQAIEGDAALYEIAAAMAALSAAKAVSETKVKLIPTAEELGTPVQPQDFSDKATIAGLEASIGHLSSLVNEQLLLLEEVNDNLGVDGIGVELDDDQSPTIAKVRAHLAAMAPPVQPQDSPVGECAVLSESKPQAQGVSICFMSPDQLQLIQDPEDVSGKYIPLRKTSAGKFTMALYAHPQASEPVAVPKGWKLVPECLTEDALKKLAIDALESSQDCIQAMTDGPGCAAWGPQLDKNDHVLSLLKAAAREAKK